MSDSDRAKSILNALKTLDKSGLDLIYISSFDEFLNEYTPKSNSIRFLMSGFSGSVAEMLWIKNQKPRLYVDGRYFEQADQEVPLDLIDVVKCEKGITQSMLDDVKDINASSQNLSMGLFLKRTPYGLYQKLEEMGLKLSSYELDSSLHFEGMSYKSLKEVQFGDDANEEFGDAISEKLKRLNIKAHEAYFTSQMDSVSWITNSRGYHLPFLSSVMGRVLVTASKVHFFIHPEIRLDKKFETPHEHLVIHQVSDLEKSLKAIIDQENINVVKLNYKQLNSHSALTFEKLKSQLTNFSIEDGPCPFISVQSIKTELEQKIIKENFKKGDRAIFETLKWVKQKVSNQEEVKEIDIYHQTSLNYKAQGAIDQSFNTISGLGANSSIIHFSSPGQTKATSESWLLLDSGGYFQGGFATDTTRTIITSLEPQNVDKKFQRIYTLVLKGLLQCQNAIFKEGTTGVALDILARSPLFQSGYNFNHGTGHGVGIHVHEGGAGISPRADYVLEQGHVVSIEPGLYLPGYGGVRLENIALVKRHPSFEGFLYFEPLVYIGYESSLIDDELLTNQERAWLDEYESICKDRGTSFQSLQ